MSLVIKFLRSQLPAVRTDLATKPQDPNRLDQIVTCCTKWECFSGQLGIQTLIPKQPK